MSAASPTLAEAVDRHRVDRPDDLALAAPGERLTWLQLAQAAAGLEATLARARLAGHTRVVIALPSSPAWVVAFLACLRAGATVVSSGRPRTHAELRALCEETGAQTVIADVGRASRSRAVASVGVVRVDVERACPTVDADREVTHVLPVDAATGVVHFTSGSTGRRKAVLRSERSLLHEGAAIAEVLALRRMDPMLLTAPVFHSFGAGMLAAALVGGTPAALVPGFSVTVVLRLIDDACAVVLVGVPYVFQTLAQLKLTRQYDTAALRLGIAGGTPLHAGVTQRFRERFGTPIAQEYGLSEVGVVSINVDDPDGRPASVGRALPGLEVRSEAAELVVHRGVDRASDVVHTERVATGDLGNVDADGFISIAGRIKHMVNVGGLKVAPHDVEARLLAEPGLEDVAIVALPDPLLGERVAAAVVAQRDAPLARDEFYARCRRMLAPHEIPRKVVWLERLPRLRSGKPDLKTIGQLVASARSEQA